MFEAGPLVASAAALWDRLVALHNPHQTTLLFLAVLCVLLVCFAFCVGCLLGVFPGSVNHQLIGAIGAVAFRAFQAPAGPQLLAAAGWDRLRGHRA